jgi:hypothetical protein
MGRKYQTYRCDKTIIAQAGKVLEAIPEHAARQRLAANL